MSLKEIQGTKSVTLVWCILRIVYSQTARYNACGDENKNTASKPCMSRSLADSPALSSIPLETLPASIVVYHFLPVYYHDLVLFDVPQASAANSGPSSFLGSSISPLIGLAQVLQLDSMILQTLYSALQECEMSSCLWASLALMKDLADKSLEPPRTPRLAATTFPHAIEGRSRLA